MEKIQKIQFNIYAADEQEGEMGRQAIIQFINIMGKHGAKVSGKKIAEAVRQMQGNPFILNQIINFFKQ